MPIGLAVFQGKHQPLAGLCAQLRCAGHRVFTGSSLAAWLEAADDHDIDVVMIDGAWRDAKSISKDVGTCSALQHAPVILVAANTDNAETCASWAERIDDLIVLPIDSVDLKSRVVSQSRLASMAAECRKRHDALADFGIAPPSNAPASTDIHGISAMIVGPADIPQVEILKAFEGRMSACYAASAAEAIVQLDHAPTDIVLVTSGISASELRSLFHRIKSTPEWCDLPILIIADSAPAPMVEAIDVWGEAELLSPSTHPAVTRLRLQALARLWRLRRQLRGLMVSRLHSPVMDGTTSLYGHGFLHHYVDRSIVNHRQRDAPLTVAVCALTGLADVNATSGYPAGDRLLLEIALKIVGSCRAQDLVARVSGSRFAVVLNNTSAREAMVVCRRLNGVLEKALRSSSEANQPKAKLTLGLSEMARHDDASILIGRASRQALPERTSRAS